MVLFVKTMVRLFRAGCSFFSAGLIPAQETKNVIRMNMEKA
jgi:hypothetical protein